MRYYCNNCERDFDEEDLVPVMQWDGEGVMGGYHVVESECPYCGSTDDWEEAEECDYCGEYFGEETGLISALDMKLCKDCAQEVVTEFCKMKWGKVAC